MASDHYTAPTASADGETADAADINSINTATLAAFETLEAEVDSNFAAAQDYSSLSQGWAETAEDTVVPTQPAGSYSAKHYAAKAATSATNASTSETNAATSASTASTQASTATTQASNASTSATNASASETAAAASETAAASSASSASTSATQAASSYTDTAALLPTWAGTSNITTLGTITTGIWNGTAIGDSYIASAATWNAKQDALTFGIADTNAVDIDSATVTNAEYAKFTTSGLESRSYAEVKTDLSLDNVENTALSTYTVPATLGGTGLTTIAAGGMWYASSTDNPAVLTKGSAGQILQMDSTGSIPEWSSRGSDGAFLHAYATYNGQTLTINDSYNVDSLTDVSAGQQKINTTTSLSISAEACVVANTNTWPYVTLTWQNDANTFTTHCFYTSTGAAADIAQVSVVVCGT